MPRSVWQYPETAGATRWIASRAWNARWTCKVGGAPDKRPQRRGGGHGCKIDRIADDRLRAGVDPREALFGHRSEQGDLLQHAAQGLRLATQTAVPLPEGRGSGRARRRRQGL